MAEQLAQQPETIGELSFALGPLKTCSLSGFSVDDLEQYTLIKYMMPPNYGEANKPLS